MFETALTDQQDFNRQNFKLCTQFFTLPEGEIERGMDSSAIHRQKNMVWPDGHGWKRNKIREFVMKRSGEKAYGQTPQNGREWNNICVPMNVHQTFNGKLQRRSLPSQGDETCSVNFSQALSLATLGLDWSQQQRWK